MLEPTSSADPPASASAPENQSTAQEPDDKHQTASPSSESKPPRASAPGEAARSAPQTSLSMEELLEIFNRVPVFYLMSADHQLFPAKDGDDALALHFYADAADAEDLLKSLHALNTAMELQLGVMPLGTAFALVEGWAPSGSPVPLRLHASKAVVAMVKRDMGTDEASGEASGKFPLFGCGSLTTTSVTPFWFTPADLKRSWDENRQPGKASMPDLTVTDLRKVADLATTAGHAQRNWRTLLLLAPQASFAKAQELQDRQASDTLAGIGPEPPPLQ